MRRRAALDSGGRRAGVRARERGQGSAGPAAGRPLVSNERLEFLGDAVLGFIVARLLYERIPSAPEGELALRKSALVSDAASWPSDRRPPRLRRRCSSLGGGLRAAAVPARRARCWPARSKRSSLRSRRRPASTLRPRSSSASTSRGSSATRVAGSRSEDRAPGMDAGVTTVRPRATSTAPRDRRTTARFTATAFVDGEPLGEGRARARRRRSAPPRRGPSKCSSARREDVALAKTLRRRCSLSATRRRRQRSP